ncbi:MAG: VanW family protein [bacterium]|nr:VanW family protein [bacterium]
MSLVKLKRSRRQRLVLILVATLLLLVLVSWGYLFAMRHRIVARAEVGGLKVGGLTVARARSKLEDAANRVKTVTVTVGSEQPVELTLAELGVDYNVVATVQQVYQYGKTGSLWHQWWQQKLALVARKQFDPQLRYDQLQLRAVLQSQLYALYETDAKEVSLTIKNGTVSVVPGVAGKMLNHEAVESAIMANINHFSNKPLIVQLADFSPRFTVADGAFAKQQAEQIIAAPLGLTFDGQSFSIEPAQLGSYITTTTVTAEDSLYAQARAAGQAGKELLLATVNEDKIMAYIRALATDQINRDATNAQVQFVDGKLTVNTPSSKGYQVQAEASVAAIVDGLTKRSFGEAVDKVALAVEVLEPAINDAKLAELGIKELIGRAETSYSTSPANRKHNIALGAAKVNGTILKPDEEFDLVKVLGEVNAGSGYLPELVISNNKLERQFGGGLCQPTTTLFRAVIDAGLPITSRSNHSRRVAYYEKPSPVKGVRVNWDSSLANIGNGMVGYDATVFIPEPNLKFKNDTGHAVLIQAYVTGNKSVNFELYGTNDGRKVTVSKAVIDYTKAPPDPQFQPDPSKPSMTMELVEKGVPGAKTRFDYTITYPDGRADKQTFESFYRPIPEQYLVGTAVPQPLPEGQTDPNAQPAP